MRRKIIAGAVLVAVVLSVLAAAVWSRGAGSAVIARGGNIGVVYIDGVITTGSGSYGFLSAGTGSEDVAAILHRAARDPSLRAVVLRMNSPGGTPAAAQEIAEEVDYLCRAGKKVVVSMGDIAASGAYWIASRADMIVANPGTITGSIGVIIETQDLHGLYEKLGIGTETFKSGPYKDMGSTNRPVAPEEREIFQDMVDDTYRQFLEVVAEGREMKLEEVEKLADGRIFTGRQALDAGLVDKLGNFQTAVREASRLAGIEGEPVVVELTRRGGLQDIFKGLLPGGSAVTRALDRYPSVWLLCPLLPEQLKGRF